MQQIEEDLSSKSQEVFVTFVADFFLFLITSFKKAEKQ